MKLGSTIFINGSLKSYNVFNRNKYFCNLKIKYTKNMSVNYTQFFLDYVVTTTLWLIFNAFGL